jgi:hypothetical protein
MHFSTAFVAVLPALALAAPTTSLPKRQVNEDIATAAANWLQDTGFVSSYLDAAATLAPADVLTNGVLALNAENDETNHKMILDNFFVLGTNAPNQAVANAKAILESGTFQTVVNLLGDISQTGNLADVQAINNVRCSQVLPAIDQYFIAVAQALGQTTFAPAIRPAACGGVRPTV